MRVFFEQVPDYFPVRRQPWTEAEGSSESKYYNFRKNPELISEVLEDFKPLSHYKSVQSFYDLLRWINGDDSPFESNDCRMGPPAPTPQRNLADKKLVRSGGLMFFFRDLKCNLSEDSKDWAENLRSFQSGPLQVRPTPNSYYIWLAERCFQELQRTNRESITDCISISHFPVLYDEAPVSSEDDRFGCQIAFRFWVWGDTDDEIITNFDKTVSAMTQCLQTIASDNS